MLWYRNLLPNSIVFFSLSITFKTEYYIPCEWFFKASQVFNFSLSNSRFVLFNPGCEKLRLHFVTSLKKSESLTRIYYVDYFTSRLV